MKAAIAVLAVYTVAVGAMATSGRVPALPKSVRVETERAWVERLKQDGIQKRDTTKLEAECKVTVCFFRLCITYNYCGKNGGDAF